MAVPPQAGREAVWAWVREEGAGRRWVSSCFGVSVPYLEREERGKSKLEGKQRTKIPKCLNVPSISPAPLPFIPTRSGSCSS